MAEWFKATVLKTVESKAPGVRIPLPPFGIPERLFRSGSDASRKSQRTCGDVRFSQGSKQNHQPGLVRVPIDCCRSIEALRSRLAERGQFRQGQTCWTEPAWIGVVFGRTVKIVSLIGSLEQFDLANIFRRLEVFSKTGLLVARQGEMWVEFYFRQGQLVCVGPVRANVSLLDRLLQAKLLLPQSLPQVRQIIEPSEVNETRIALALINEGYLSREILRAWAAHETSQILQAIFSWPTGEIYFEEDHQTPPDRLLVALSISALLDALPSAALAPRPATVSAPSTDEPVYPVSAPLTGAGTGGPLPQNPPFTPSMPGTLNASQLVEQSPVFRQPDTPPQGMGLLSAAQLVEQSPALRQPQRPPQQGRGLLNASQLIEQPPAFQSPQTPNEGEGLFNAAQLIDEFPFKQANAGASISAAQLVEDVAPPSFASANPTGLLGPEVDISASTQVSILPPQPVRNPLPPARIDTSFMTPDLVLAPVDLSTLRERNPQVQLTPDQWSLFALIDGQLPLQALCQTLNAPAEQVCMVAGELIAIGLVMPLTPITGALSELMSPAMAPASSYPSYAPPMMAGPASFTPTMETQSQWGNGRNGASFVVGGGWQQGMPGQSQASSAYAPVGGYR